MKNNEELQNSQKQSETEKELDKLQEVKYSLAFAIERTNLDLLDIDNTAKDLSSLFNIHTIRKGLRFGSLGKYGINNRLNTQVICSWVWKYKKENELGI